MSGRADLTVGEAAEALREAGHEDLAERLERELVGRNVLDGRWTFQVVEEFDDGYWSVSSATSSASPRRAHPGACGTSSRPA